MTCRPSRSIPRTSLPNVPKQVPPLLRLNYFDPEFRFPRTLKLAVGADLLLPGGVVGTVDLLYTRGVNTFQVVDVNLNGPLGSAAGEGGRVMYGTIDPTTGEATPFRRTTELDALFEIRNGSGDHAFSATAQLQKRFANGAELSAAYTYTRAKDRVSSSEDEPGPNAGLTPVNGTLDRLDLAYFPVGAAPQGDAGGHHRSSARLPARPRLYRRVQRAVYLCARE